MRFNGKISDKEYKVMAVLGQRSYNKLFVLRRPLAASGLRHICDQEKSFRHCCASPNAIS
jgi:hypothetical protein